MNSTTTFDFVLIDDFSMMSVVTAIEPLRVANRILGEERYVWRMSREDGGAAPQASNRLNLPCSVLENGQDVPDYTFVCAGMHTKTRDPEQLHATLRHRRRMGGIVGGISLAPAIVARAGLLSGKRAVIHWEGYAAFVEEFHDVEISTGLYEIDQGVMTSSGGLATMDLVLEILKRDYESWLVQAVSNQLQISHVRTGSAQQIGGLFRLPVTAPRIMHKAIALIDQNIETPLSPDEIAQEVGSSRRNLDRQFKAQTFRSLAEFYMVRRLEYAQSILNYSNMQLREIAIATGFRSASHFTAAFKNQFGCTPQQFRKASTV